LRSLARSKAEGAGLGSSGSGSLGGLLRLGVSDMPSSFEAR
jgi:hypothetical protein